MTQKSRFTVGLNEDLHNWMFDQIGEGKRWWNVSHAITEAVRRMKDEEEAANGGAKNGKTQRQKRELTITR